MRGWQRKGEEIKRNPCRDGEKPPWVSAYLRVLSRACARPQSIPNHPSARFGISCLLVEIFFNTIQFCPDPRQPKGPCKFIANRGKRASRVHNGSPLRGPQSPKSCRLRPWKPHIHFVPRKLENLSGKGLCGLCGCGHPKGTQSWTQQ